MAFICIKRISFFSLVGAFEYECFSLCLFWQVCVGRCTAPWSLAHIGLVLEHWRNPISYRNRCTNCTRSQKLLFLIELGVCWIVKYGFQADWKKKISALCSTEGKKKMWFFFCSRRTRKINLEFSLGRLFECYNHREFKYSKWKILLLDFVVKLYLFLEVLLYFSNLLWTQVLGITWVL